MFKRLSFIALSAILLATACKKEKEGDVFTRTLPLTPQQVVPTQNPMSSASGSVTATYDQRTRVLSYTLTWTGTDSVRAIHLHGPAEAGFNAPILQSVTIPSSGVAPFPVGFSGTWTNSVTIDNVVVKESDLLANRYYIDMHTKSRMAAGELRAQLNINP